ncbi:MAG: aminotransferase class IV [Myxococcota bacterium]|nr:aminotransferase class IV [Myxococcota bacterium]
MGSSEAAPAFVWTDGELRDRGEAVVRADDGAFRAGVGCYTTARFEAGGLRHAGPVAERLVRDAERLGLPAIDPERVSQGLLELARACFGERPGIVRMQASADGAGRTRLVATARPIGPEPATWRVRTAPWRHEGPGPFSGVKLTGHPLMEHVRSWLRGEGRAEEGLLFDESGHLVEGSRSTPVVHTADGRWITPPLARGGVAGVARALVLAASEEVHEADASAEQLAACRELVMVNSVRGARPVAVLDGAPMESGGPLLGHLSEALAGQA